MPEFIEIQRKFVNTLLRIPGIDTFPVRSDLLLGLPRVVERYEYNARTDLNKIISGFQQLGRLNDQGGTRPLIRVAENALQYVTEGGEVANTLNEVIRELNQYYGGDVQPEPTPLPAGEQEALVFGRQRDTRLSFAFIEGAQRTSKSVARLSVPRIFNGVKRQGEDGLSFGTAWLIAPGLIITNYHVINARDPRRGEPPPLPEDFDEQAKQVEAWFDYYLENGPHLTCHNATLVASNKQLDYAILRLTEAMKVANRAPLRIVTAQPELEQASRLNIVQHSGGGALRYAIRNNFFARNGGTPDFIRYQTDTEAGASGSPVCDDAWHVVALHHGSKGVPATQVSQEVIDGNPVTITVLNEATAIHSILNSLPTEVKEQILAAQVAQGWR